MKSLFRAIAFTLVALAAGIARAQLSETEQRIVAAVKERTPASLQLLERAVRVNSGTLNVEGVREVGRIFQAELDSLGFATRWAEMPPQLKDVGVLDGTTIAVMFTGDEESVGSPVEKSRGDMVALAKRSDIALSFEGAGKRDGRDEAVVARRASGSFEIDVKARAGHSMRIFAPATGYGAVFEAARILNAFREQLIEPNLTFSPGLVLGGTDVKYDVSTASGTAFGKTNVVPKEAHIRGNMRYLTPEQGARARQKMETIAAANLPGTSATITFREAYPPMAPTDANLRLLEIYSRASADAGMGPIVPGDPAARGAGDVQFTAPYVPGLDGLGTAGSGIHTDDEELEIASIERGAIRAAILIYRLTRP